jgi:hypothetical protein
MMEEEGWCRGLGEEDEEIQCFGSRTASKVALVAGPAKAVEPVESAEVGKKRKRMSEGDLQL